MLSEKLHDALNEQINAELWSAYLYLSMSMDAEAKGLKGVANWFFVQFQEEQDHARILMNYINSRDAKVELKPIAEVRTEWTSPLDMFKDTLEHEKVVTSMINNLASIAAEDKDFASANMLVWFVDEQVEEEEGFIRSTRSWPRAYTSRLRRWPRTTPDRITCRSIEQAAPGNRGGYRFTL